MSFSHFRTGSSIDTLTPDSATSSRFSQIVKPFCAAKNVTCDPYEKYRSYDGKCNNLRNPLWGSALTAQPRFLSANYGDRYNSGSEPRKNSVRYGSLPNPRDISNTVHKDGTTFARSCLSNVAFTHFGQFIDHDVVSTPTKKSKKGEAKLQCCDGNTPVNRPECLSFSTPVGEFKTTCMHFVRSETAPRSDCSPGYSDQMNQVTSYLDLSSTYGSSKKMADELVDWTTGKLFEGTGGLLPDGEGECIKGAQCFKSGDIRHTEVPMLNAIHTMFMREHNRIVGILKKINPHHDGPRLYNEARKILIGVYQHIVYKEFIPKLLGTTLARYHGLLPTTYGHKTHYNQNTNGGTRNGFAGAAFRIGHTFVGKFVGTLDAYYNINEQVPLQGEFFNPRTIRSTQTFSVDKISNWMVEKFSGQSDRFVSSAVRNHLFETKPGNGFDLSALNIQRGRDHGLPSYNKFRKFCGLRPALTFGYSTLGLRDMSYASAGALQRMYRHPDDIDLFTGGLSETPVQGGLVGPTFGCLIALQFKYYRNGDRFFYENAFSNTGFTSAQLGVIKKQTMSSLYCRNFNFAQIQADAFVSSKSSTCSYGLIWEKNENVLRLDVRSDSQDITFEESSKPKSDIEESFGVVIDVHGMDEVILYLVAFGAVIDVHGMDEVILYLVAFGVVVDVHGMDEVILYLVAFGTGVEVHGMDKVVLNVRAYTLGCAAGWWSILEFLFPGCDYAICDGKTVFTGACNKYYPNDYQKTKDKGIVRSSGGTCSSPDTCTNCNDGFYSNGPYCEMCGPIANCNHRRCTSGSNQVCAWCDGEVKYSPYWRAYTSHLDTTKCQKACSWRSDSTRCYPGTCSNELAANCQCAANFGGTHCENIQDTPAIEYNHCKFTDDQGINIVENEPNYVQQSHPIIWTNFLGYTKMKTSMVAKYIQPADNRDPDSYITGFRVGVIEQRTTMSYYSAGTVTPSVKTLTCPGMHRDQPVDFQTCPMDFSIWNGMGHDDKILYEVSSTNGGYVDVANRENGITTRYYYQGQTLTRTFEYHWDVVNPYHCSVSAGKSCTHFISIPTDITNNPIMTFSWDGWSDDLAGILYYEYQVFDLDKDGTQLVDGRVPVANAGNKPINDTLQDTFTVTTAGVYSIHLSVFDKAGNHKTGRGIFFFDDISVVDKTGEETKCATASKDTLYEWVVQDTNTVQIVWPDRFINVRHLNNGWLYGVQTFAPHPDISLYEDLYGNRTNAAIKNKRGIVDFKVSFEVHDPSLKDSRPLTSVIEIYNQYEYLTLNWADGDRLTVTVKALDVIHESKNDTITVYRDATPPIIQNLWLTLGDRLNVTVHRIEEFTKMTIEWEAFDLHSGLDSVNWKLYDNYGGAVVLHGHEHIIAQGNSENLTVCQDNYGSRPRGANCYCTAFMGCYHRHFHVIPEIKTTSGLFTNKDRGVHDSDYFIEVNVTNKAKLTTVLTRKITVDISPPHAGAVHDGLVGNPEVDYQQGMNLNAYWDQFFDRESGVFFYQYLVGTSCAEKNDFNLNLTAANVTETYNNFGSYTADGDGTYYFTVVAYNRALDPSEPVCSDGVTIDSSIPGVKEVMVEDAVITGGLITDTNQTNYYILSSQRVRRMIANVTADCIMKATILTDIDLFPLEQYDNGTLPMVNGDVFCINSTGAPSSIGLTLSKSSLMEFSWKPIDIPAQVYDYELGFSSTPGSMAPDIMAFESTNQHAHHRVTHGNVPDGTEFYIIIKTISKSNVEGLSTLGPCFIDTTSPDFSGSISVSLSGNILIAVWNLNGFSDSEELFEMDYQFAIGSRAYGTDIQSYQPIRGGGSCTITVPPTCTATDIHELDWYLHGFHTYYVSIKATNSAGQANIQTSSPYIHAVEPPTEGVVIDIDTQV
ncbi:uncharacterized protein [Mytilus edulis]|uniref:uncharacterized protein n=1 Tax=Mytilus edulis TaxID=6550 RepID=UPI0039F11A25